MSGSNQEGRNQKLVIDYLEALLCDSEDSIIEVTKEVSSSKFAEHNAMSKEALAPETVQQPEISKDSAIEPQIIVEDELSESELIVVEAGDATNEQKIEESTGSIAVQSTEKLEEAVNFEIEPNLAEENVPEAVESLELVESFEVEEQPQQLERAQALEELLEIESDAEILHVEGVEEQALEAAEIIIQADDLDDVDLETVVEGLQIALENEVSQQGEVLEAPVANDKQIEEPLVSSEESSDTSEEVPATQAIDDEIKIEAVVDSDTEEHAEIENSENEVVEASQPDDHNIESDELMHSNEIEESGTELSINCLIVLMYGLKLAIPFEQIEGHIKLSNVTLSIDNERDWIIGDFTSLTMRTHIVDTAQMLFGDNYDPLKSNYNDMLVLQGKHWSIVFDKVIKTKNIKLSDVAENASPQFRPWLTGTYMQEKCALVNVSAMVKMFEEELNG